jgi:hypothetical protein
VAESLKDPAVCKLAYEQFQEESKRQNVALSREDFRDRFLRMLRYESYLKTNIRARDEFRRQAEEARRAEFSRKQSERASHPRAPKIDGKTIKKLVVSLALRKSNLGLAAKELWPKLFDALYELGCDPERVDDPGNTAWEAYRYYALSSAGKVKKMITYGHFANLVSEARKKSP